MKQGSEVFTLNGNMSYYELCNALARLGMQDAADFVLRQQNLLDQYKRERDEAISHYRRCQEKVPEYFNPVKKEDG